LLKNPVVFAVCAALALLVPSVANAQHARFAAMSIAVKKSSHPHTITKKKPTVTFHMKVSGIKLQAEDPRKFCHYQNVKGHGHIQIYLDKIPKAAYKPKAPISSRLKNRVNYASLKTFTLGLDSQWIKEHKGKHVLRLALSNNKCVLYHVPAASFKLKVK
jgi:hypothetical protein